MFKSFKTNKFYCLVINSKMSGNNGMSPIGSLGGRAAMSPNGPMMAAGANTNNQRFGSGSAYTPGGMPG